MSFYADFHIHSSYSRATSKSITPETIFSGACIKGIKLIGSGDGTHPAWIKDLEEKMEPADNGLYRLKPDFVSPLNHTIPDSCFSNDVFFILTSEISCIYKKADKVRKIHVLLLSSSLENTKKFNNVLDEIGNIRSDGRPILGMDVCQLLQIFFENDPEGIFIPAHIWTPHFSLFGSKSGFDSIDECFGEYKKEIFALETGLSSDPSMNWLISELDKYTLISNSDAHSTAKIGRECNHFDCELSFSGIKTALKEKEQFLETIEFYPEEGRYHFDGHRKCEVCLHPLESKDKDNLCPQCGKKMTIGVLHRVMDLADREPGYVPEKKIPFTRLIGLESIISSVLQVGTGSKRVQQTYEAMLNDFGSELYILKNLEPEKVIPRYGSLMADGISRNRQGKVNIRPGYDGEYGVINLFAPEDFDRNAGQKELFAGKL